MPAAITNPSHWPLQRFFRLVLPVLAVILAVAGQGHARTVVQMIPVLSVSEEYRDNFFSTRTGRQEEFITTYALSFTAGFLAEKHQLYLSYSPTYKDYKNLDDRDRVGHYVSLKGQITPARHTDLAYGLVYDGDSDNLAGESRTHEAHFSGTTRAGKATRLTYGHTYADQYDRRARTGDYREHTRNTSRAGIEHQYGPRNHARVTFLYEFDSYETTDPDAYTRYLPAGYLSYWFSPKIGMDAGLSYDDRDFTDTDEYARTLSGDARLIRPFSKTLDIFVKYRHTYTETDTYTHHIFHPSAGFDWDVTQDSGISLGAGILFHDWSDGQGDDMDWFLDLDMYRNFSFSPATTLAITGISGYESAGEEAASLGYTTYYQAGARLSHALSRHLTTSLTAAFRMDDYQERTVDRKDTRLILGAGLLWQPLQWLFVDVGYTFTDFNTTDDLFREDYTDNRVFFTLRLVPEQPITPDTDPTRQALEDRLFQWDR